MTPDAGKAVADAKAGQVEYRLDKSNIIHCPMGKVSFGVEKLEENFNALVGAVIKAKPAAAKGQYIKSCTVASSMGPGIRVNPAKLTTVDRAEQELRRIIRDNGLTNPLSRGIIIVAFKDSRCFA